MSWRFTLRILWSTNPHCKTSIPVTALHAIVSIFLPYHQSGKLWEWHTTASFHSHNNFPTKWDLHIDDRNESRNSRNECPFAQALLEMFVKGIAEQKSNKISGVKMKFFEVTQLNDRSQWDTWITDAAFLLCRTGIKLAIQLRTKLGMSLPQAGIILNQRLQ